ncbi:SPFH domain-containing protein [Pseudoduganella umbonata]|uniref:Regulator of protease activity HflC (Stomatin/prohibitin superfamily) n=1 Tax=Pseudoduganella umbonata TaxID=864828 RepID=A0A4P8HNT9_9BURK|nr:SPFH domain-containing protein [Pseudoduganella umbonata]MBB3220103.1 regulator of protease activity HflC (stomatin/prohibitin superfamily) [Pseudoduganella umbonata]QCP10098.1 SPFH domain-containing protein [Pseudoduganella umbonata]
MAAQIRPEARRETPFTSVNGYLAAAGGVLLVVAGALALRGFLLLPGILLIAAGVFLAAGLYMLQPNETAILTLFGKYVGTDRTEGLRWAFPLYRKRKLTVRARNLNVATLKVNDRRGNPIEIGAAVVWRVQDTAQAVFEVDDFERYVSIQAEAALRHLASQYAYDEADDLATGETTLRAGANEVALALRAELSARFEAAGVETVDAKLTHLAYAAEIAQVMLRRQQAEAIISARAKIVHGAVTMVDAALKALAERDIVELDPERKAAMVSNLLVVLCSDQNAQPIINAGTLYN